MSGKSNLQRVLLALPFLVVPSLSFAADLNGANTAWILTATALVLFMTIPGLSLFYAGLVRSKNVLSVLMQCFTLTCLMSILWFVVGYTIAFGSLEEQGSFIGDFGNVLFADMSVDSMNGDIPAVLFAAFQMTFAVITPALIVGAFAERMKFSSMLLFSSAWLLLVYAPVCHWVWGGGWLAEMGFLDFAGGAVVHITAAVAALVAALVIGNRNGFPTTVMMPNNMTMTVTGAGMLWVGWFGFNAGSALAADGSAAMALLVTHISAAAGSLAWMTCEWVKHGKPSVLGIVTGMVAGLATVTPASGFIGVPGGLILGLAGGFGCYIAVDIIRGKLKIDDSLDVFAVHGVGGIIGSLMVAFLALPSFGGLGLTDGVTPGSQFMVQLASVAITVAWTLMVSVVILMIAKTVVGLRVDDQTEVDGLDLAEHGERGYPGN